MQKTNFNLPGKRVYKGWAQVFENPRPIKLESFLTGTVIINKKGTLNPHHPRARDVKSEELEVPILAHGIQHKEWGDYLLDAGLDASYYRDPRGGVDDPVADEFKEGKNQNIGFYIQDRKIQLNGVFLSHLHADHIAGVRELPKDIPYVIGKGEWDLYRPDISGNSLDTNTNSPDGTGDFLRDIKTLYEIDFSKLDEMAPLGPSADVLGDGSLWAVWTPGHTPGHMSFLLNGLEGPVFLTMDACFIQENLDRMVAPSDYTWNVRMAQETLEKVFKFLEMYPQVRVMCGHEPSNL